MDSCTTRGILGQGIEAKEALKQPFVYVVIWVSLVTLFLSHLSSPGWEVVHSFAISSLMYQRQMGIVANDHNKASPCIIDEDTHYNKSSCSGLMEIPVPACKEYVWNHHDVKCFAHGFGKSVMTDPEPSIASSTRDSSSTVVRAVVSNPIGHAVVAERRYSDTELRQDREQVSTAHSPPTVALGPQPLKTHDDV